MRMVLVVAASLMLACSAGCEKTVREARNSTSRQQQMRRPAFAPRPVTRTTQTAARSTRTQTAARPAASSQLLRTPSLPPQLRGTASAQRSTLLPSQQRRQAQAPAKPSLLKSVLNYPKKYLSKLANLM